MTTQEAIDLRRRVEELEKQLETRDKVALRWLDSPNGIHSYGKGAVHRSDCPACQFRSQYREARGQDA